MPKYHLLKQHTGIRSKGIGGKGHHVSKLSNPSVDARHVESFETVIRSMLLQELAKVLDPDELHIIKVLTNIQLKFRCGNEKSDAYETDTGVPQGDCVSANLFTFYLAKALGSNKHDDHDYSSTIVKPPAHITNDHQYAYINDEINLNMEYADDMSHISSDMRNIEYVKKTLL